MRPNIFVPGWCVCTSLQMVIELGKKEVQLYRSLQENNFIQDLSKHCAVYFTVLVSFRCLEGRM